jgi:hypothetical protein
VSRDVVWLIFGACFCPPLGVKVALWRDLIHATVTRPGRDEPPVFFRLNSYPVLRSGEFFLFPRSIKTLLRSQV